MHGAAAHHARGCRLSPLGVSRRRLDEGRAATGPAAPPARPHLELRARTATSLHLEWEEPDDHGDEIYMYALQVAEHAVTWRQATADFFDDYRPATLRGGGCNPVHPPCNPMAPSLGRLLLHRPWRLVHEGTATVRACRLGGLKPANAHLFRLVAKNSGGTSQPAEASFVTAELDRSTRGDEPVPRGWLTNDLADVVAEFTMLTGLSSFDFVAEA